MKAGKFVAFAVSLLMMSCTVNAGPSEIPSGMRTVTATPVITATASPANETGWNVYSADPEHIWNRLFRQLYRRTTSDGQEYGRDSLDPLLWYDTTYLLEGASYRDAISVLDEFLAAKSEDGVIDPLRRAMFQRDLWAVFDWLAFQSDPYPAQRQELQRRLAQVIRKVALTEDQIQALPDNYAEAVRSSAFPTGYRSQDPERAFLPPDLLDPESEWVCLGRAGGPLAMTHTESFPFLGRSVFLVFVRVPGGRAAALKFLQELNDKKPFTLQLAGTDVALVRRALLIDDQGQITASPLIESVQIRHFTHVDQDSAVQSSYELQLERGLLFAGTAGGLRPITREFMTFSSQGDVFQMRNGEGQARIPEVCGACHEKGKLTVNLLSYSRFRFPLSDGSSPFLVQTTPELEAHSVILWKQEHPTWQALQRLIN